jgi:hypothetical protein
VAHRAEVVRLEPTRSKPTPSVRTEFGQKPEPEPGGWSPESHPARPPRPVARRKPFETRSLAESLPAQSSKTAPAPARRGDRVAALAKQVAARPRLAEAQGRHRLEDAEAVETEETVETVETVYATVWV